LDRIVGHFLNPNPLPKAKVPLIQTRCLCTSLDEAPANRFFLTPKCFWCCWLSLCLCRFLSPLFISCLNQLSTFSFLKETLRFPFSPRSLSPSPHDLYHGFRSFFFFFFMLDAFRFPLRIPLPHLSAFFPHARCFLPSLGLAIFVVWAPLTQIGTFL